MSMRRAEQRGRVVDPSWARVISVMRAKLTAFGAHLANPPHWRGGVRGGSSWGWHSASSCCSADPPGRGDGPPLAAVVRLAGRCLLAALLTLGPALAGAADPGVVFEDDLTGGRLEERWTIDVSAGNTVALSPEGLEINAAENTYAHLERPLRVDLIRAQAAILPGSGISWCTSLFLYWGPGDWCQMGVIPRHEGSCYACVTAEGQRSEHDLGRCRMDVWQHLAVELAEDGIRFLSSTDGAAWRLETILPRPPRLGGAPALLIVGKGFGLDATTPDLDGDYGERGAPTVSRVRHVRVTQLPAERRRITVDERRARELADCDPHGTAILARGVDPNFDTVSAVFPPLSKPREVVGVAEHRYEVGVEYDGTIQLADDTDLWEQTGATAWFEVGDPPVRFGSGGCRKSLPEGYLPVVAAEWEHDGLRYKETVLGHSTGMSPEAELWAYAHLFVDNLGDQPRTVPVRLVVRPAPEGYAAPARTLEVPPGKTIAFCVRVPSPLAGRAVAEVDLRDFQAALEKMIGGWQSRLEQGLRLRVPERRVNEAYRAWLAFNYLNMDMRADGPEPHDGSGFYEEVFGYSAVLWANALDLYGHHAAAERYLETLLSRQRDDGLFFIRYGMADHGAMLLVLSQHYRLTGDADWLRRTAPRIVRMGEWIAARRAEARAAPDGNRELTRGLIRFMPYADYSGATFNYYGDAYCCAGLEQAATVLAEIGLSTEAQTLGREAAEYRRDILASMDAAVFERDGVRMLPIEPVTHRILKSTNYRGGGYYGLVASMLLESEFLPPTDPRAGLLVNMLEKRGGLILGMCEFDRGIDHAYTYGYWLNCLRRDEVARVLLGFYGSLAYGMGRDTYCGVEVTQIATGEPTPTTPHLYSGTQQLRLLRMMLVREEGEELVIGQALPRPWLAPGQSVELLDAPTAFGTVSCTLRSAADGSGVTVTLAAPQRRPPHMIRLHVRHPAGKAISGVEVDGQAMTDFSGEVICLRPANRPVVIQVRY